MSALKLCPTCGAEYPANERFCPKDGSALRAQGSSNDLVGSMIADRYHVIKKLGEGGMGQVYLVEHVKMGRKSALKVMNASMAQDADAISRFNREASNASRINHPHVAGIYDFGETADGVIYLAMEYVEGEPLTDLVSSAGALSPERAAEITRQTGEALAVAHEMGIVHRDLKPDNIMITRDRDGGDCVKVVDFGIAKAANVEAQKVTRTGLVIGTPEYMSPEQLAGDPLDGRSDIYSLGLVAFHMLTGGLPFPSETVQESMIMRLTDQPKRLAEMRPQVSWTPAVQTVMDRALQRDVKDRFQSASEFGRALKSAVDAMPATREVASVGANVGASGIGAARDAVPATRLSESPAAPARPSSSTKKRSTAMLVGAAALAFVIVGVGAVIMASRDTNATPLASKTSNASTVAATPSGAGEAPVSPSASAPVPAPTPAVNQPVQRVASSVSPVNARQTRSDSAVSPVSQPSYRAELVALSDSIVDPPSALRAAKRLQDFRNKVTLASDRATVQVIQAQVAAMDDNADAAKTCALWRRIKPDDVISELKHAYDEGMKYCERI